MLSYAAFSGRFCRLSRGGGDDGVAVSAMLAFGGAVLAWRLLELAEVLLGLVGLAWALAWGCGFRAEHLRTTGAISIGPPGNLHAF